jgi:hypothetical protein
VFQLAARVSVKVARVDLERAKIDFTLDESALDRQANPAMPVRPVIPEPLARRDRPSRPGADDSARAVERSRTQNRPRAKKTRRG